MTTVTTQIQNRWLPIDELGAFIGLRRNDGETIRAFQSRIMDQFIHRANASYTGLVYGIARELGYEHKLALSITCDNTDFNWAGVKTPMKLYLFSNLASLTAHVETPYSDITIQAYDEFPTISNIVSTINQTSDFAASIKDVSVMSEPAKFLINDFNRKIHRQQMDPSTVFDLEQDNIHRGSLYISATEAFQLEVPLSIGPQAHGEYSIDLKKGIVYTYTYPSDKITFSYKYTQDPFELYHIPVAITPFNSEWAGSLFFQQWSEQVYDNTIDASTNAIPRPELIDFITELKRVARIYWGT